MDTTEAQPSAAHLALIRAKAAMGLLMQEERRSLLRHLTAWLDELDRRRLADDIERDIGG